MKESWGRTQWGLSGIHLPLGRLGAEGQEERGLDTGFQLWPCPQPRGALEELISEVPCPLVTCKVSNPVFTCSFRCAENRKGGRELNSAPDSCCMNVSHSILCARGHCCHRYYSVCCPWMPCLRVWHHSKNSVGVSC